MTSAKSGINMKRKHSTSFTEAGHVDRGHEDDGAKTSEYAFFKKLKKDAAQRVDFHSMQREKNPPNKLNSSECCRGVEGTKRVRNIYKSSEGTNIPRNCSKDLSSPLSVENVRCRDSGSLLSIEKVRAKDLRSRLPTNNVRHINSVSIHSAVDRTTNNSVVDLKNDFSAFGSMFNAKDWLEHDSKNKRPRESQSDKAELFSKKRQKFRRWAYNSFPEIEELHSKGYGLISILLSRLLPWSHEKNGCRDAGPVESDSKTELIGCPKFDIPSKKLNAVPARNFKEVEYTPLYVENGTSSYWSDITWETRPPDIYSPTYNNHSIFQNNFDSPNCELREKNSLSCVEFKGDSIFGFSFLRHGSLLPFSSFEEPDDLHDLNGNLAGREPYLPLLGWESVNDILSYGSGKSVETMLSDIHSPTYSSYSTAQKNLVLPSCELREKNLISYIDDDTTFGFPFVRHGSFLPLNSFEEPDELHVPDGSLPGRKLHLPMLEWDPVNISDRNLSATCENNTNLITIPVAGRLWSRQESLNNWCEPFGSLGLYSLPAFGNYPHDFYTLVHPNNTSYDKHDLGEFILKEEEEEMTADLNLLSSTSMQSSKCLELIADCNYHGIACKNSGTYDIFPSAGNHFDLISKAFAEENISPDSVSQLSFALDVGWKCLQPIDLGRDQRYWSTYNNDVQFSEKGRIIYSSIVSNDGYDCFWDGSSYRSFKSSKDMLDEAYPCCLINEDGYDSDSDRDNKCI